MYKFIPEVKNQEYVQPRRIIGFLLFTMRMFLYFCQPLKFVSFVKNASPGLMYMEEMRTQAKEF